MIDCYRHGEICFEKIDSLPKGLVKSKSKEFLRGSHGNPHIYSKGDFYEKVEDEFIFGYFTAKGSKLFHKDHGDEKEELKTAKLGDGNYRLRRQVEFINDELKQIVD